MIVLWFWSFAAFLFLSIFFVVSPSAMDAASGWPIVGAEWPALPAFLLNIATCCYIVYYFSALEKYPYRIYLVLFFVSVSLMAGSGFSMAFRFEGSADFAGVELLSLVFGDSLLVAVNFAIATYASGWTARQFHRFSRDLNGVV